jgi:pimeloyl-ACP methyl ester carboxylesterase
MSELKRGMALLSGGGMGGWIWQRLVPLLEYPAVCIEHRVDPERFPDLRAATVADCVDYAAGVVGAAGLREVILVGHSGAGALLPFLAAALGKQVRYLVYLSANIPPQGKRMVDVIPFFMRILQHIAVSRNLRKGPPSMKRMERAVRATFCNCCDRETIRFVLTQSLRNEPPALMTEKLFRPECSGVPRMFIRLLRDKTASRAFQHRMIRNLGVADVVSIDADHMVMLSRPRELADVLNRVGERL